MKARNLEAGDVLLVKGKKFVVKKAAIKAGKVIAETSGGHLTFNPDEELTIE